MQAAHDAAEVPLLAGQILDRAVGFGRPGIEEDVEIDAGDRDDPVVEEAKGTKVIERVPLRAEDVVEQALEPLERGAQRALHERHPAGSRRSRRHRRMMARRRMNPTAPRLTAPPMIVMKIV